MKYTTHLLQTYHYGEVGVYTLPHHQCLPYNGFLLNNSQPETALGMLRYALSIDVVVDLGFHLLPGRKCTTTRWAKISPGSQPGDPS